MTWILSWWKPVTEILLLWYLYYQFLAFVKDTRAFQVLKGVVVLVALFLVTQRLQLTIISWLLTKLFAISVIAFVVLFAPELRRGLARIGQHRLVRLIMTGEEITDELVKAVSSLSAHRVGALIAIERQTGLQAFVESGVEIDGRVTTELLTSIFQARVPLHDGGVIVQGSRIAAASCLFPLTQNPALSHTLGTRHRAAIGLSEETDACVIVVSEETGTVSVALDGQLRRGLQRPELEQVLQNAILGDNDHPSLVQRLSGERKR